MEPHLSAAVPKLAGRGLMARRGGRMTVDVPELDVAAGDVLAIVGPNGAGKTTLLLQLALLQRPDAGEVLFDGAPTRGRELALRRRMAVVFQEPLLLDMSVRANVETGLRMRGVAGATRRARGERWLARFGVAALAERSSRALSGGEAQRVSLARAFCLEPEVLLLDEPFSALDTPTRAAITDDLAAVLSETGTTAVLVTHDHDEALRLGSRMAVMIGGRVRQTGRPEEVLGAPADEHVAAFVGMETIVAAEVVSRGDGLVRFTAGGRAVEAVDERAYGRALLCLRPEDVGVSRPGVAGPDSARNRLPGRVAAVVRTGADARVDVDCGFVVRARVTRRSLEELGLEAGAEVLVTFKATAVHVIPR